MSPYRLQIKRCALRARGELLRSIETRLIRIGITREGAGISLNEPSDDAAASQVQILRDEVERRGFDKVLDRAAGIWFLRIAAIRFMEVNDLLPHHVRMLSSLDGSFFPECIESAFDMPFRSLNLQLLAHQVQSGNDEAVLRLLLLAQCDELSEGMPFLFDSHDSPYDLLLPDSLLNPDGIIGRLVLDMPDECWMDAAEAFGFLFEGFADFSRERLRDRGRGYSNISNDEIVASSQNCTVGWPGRYLVDNSLGRMLLEDNRQLLHPEHCEFLLSDGTRRERDTRVEQLKVVDFACGSGALLAYSFDVLMEAYENLGYSLRDAVRLALEDNLIGFDVSEYAVMCSKLILTMKACLVDRRFLRRGVMPHVVQLEPIALSEGELALCPGLSSRRDMLDAVIHLNECGSLYAPGEADINALRSDVERLIETEADTTGVLVEKLKRTLYTLELLSSHYDVVLCDAPRTSFRRISRWLAHWIAAVYPDDRQFLPAAFIERSLVALSPEGYAALFSSSPLMFSGNATAFRKRLLDSADIVCVVETTDATGSAWSSDAGWVLSHRNGRKAGLYVRLNQHISEKRAALLGAARSSSCSYVYLRDQEFFMSIPGAPIAYWAPLAITKPFSSYRTVSKYTSVRTGLFSGNPDRFIRQWFELSLFDRGWDYHPYSNGGIWRKWYGNRDLAIRWSNDGEEIKQSYSASSLCMGSHFQPGIVWGAGLAFRLLDSDEFVIGSTGILMVNEGLRYYLLGMLNSSSFELLYKAVNTEVNAAGGEIGSTPAIIDGDRRSRVEGLVESCIAIARSDYEEVETSWGFRRSPLR